MSFTGPDLLTGGVPEGTQATAGGGSLQRKLVVAPGMSATHVEKLYSAPETFFSMCQGVREDGTVDFFNPTPVQIEFMRAWEVHNWVMVNKYRQAKMSTVAVMQMLRDCMYHEGYKGLLIAEREGTALDIMERIVFAYKHLPEAVRAPQAEGRRATATALHFWHGGNIKILTAGGRSPSIGRSPDRMVMTEFGEAQWQEQASTNIFPGINKRSHAKVCLESTPGRLGSHHQGMWQFAMEGKGRFHPLFFDWWRDPTCRVIVPPGLRIKLSPEEKTYLQKHQGMTIENILFRRMALETEFAGDTRLFSSKYPSDPHDGWIGDYAPVLPEDALKAQLADAVKTPVEGMHGCCEIQPPVRGREYVITADPAGFGNKGDPSALVVWDGATRSEVALWTGEEDPGRFADRLIQVQARYNNAMLAVESNAAACVQTLRDRGTRRMVWTNKHHPGWYATRQRLMEAESRLVRLLRDGDIILRSRELLHQLMSYDGSMRNLRVKGSDGRRHHFDLARCAVIAADVLSRRVFPEPAKTQEEKQAEREPGQISIKDLDDYRRAHNRKQFSPFGPPPSTIDRW